MATVEPKPRRLTKSYVQKRLRDWRRRIDALFKQIERWAVDEWGEASVTWGSRRQRHEYAMQQAGVPPRDLPTLTVRAEKQPLEFLPSCLWIIGANGRIDVIAGQSSYSLVATGGEESRRSDWQISNPDPRVVLEPFTRDVLRRIAKTRT